MGRGSNDLSLNVVLQASDLASGRLKGFGSTLVNLAGDAGPLLKVFGGISLAAIAVGVDAAKMAADYQQSMNMVQALTGSSTQQMAYYDAGVKQLAMDAGVAPKALADGLYNVLSASYSGATAMKVLTLATQDAKIGMTDAKITTDALTNILRSFGTKSQDITRVNGEMLQTVTLGKATFEQYATTIVKSASAANQFHVSMEVMNAAWATMTSSGIRAAQASTDFQQSLKVMYGNINTVVKSLEKNKIAFDEAKFNAMSYGDKVVYLSHALDQAHAKHVTITGVTIQASQAIQTISQHIGDYRNNLAALSDKQAMADKTAQAWAITQGGFNQSLARAQAAVQVLMIDIGQQLLPVLTRMVNAIVPAVNWLMNFAAAISQNEVAMDFIKGALVGFAVVLLAVLIPALWAWATAAGAAALATLAFTWPILLVGAIVAAVVAGILLAIQHWGAIVQWLKGAWANTASFFQGLWQGILTGLQAVGNFFVSVWNGIISGVQTAWNWIVNAAKIGAEFLLGVILGPFLAIGALFIWLYQHNTYFQRMIDAIVGFVRSGVAWLQQAWSNVVTFIAVQWVKLTNWANEQWSKITATITVYLSIVNSAIQTVWTIISGWLSAQWNKLAGFASAAWQAVSLVFSSIWSKYIAGPLSSLWNSITKWFSDLGKGAADSGKNFITMLVQGIESGAGAIWNAVVNIAQTIWKALGFHSPPAGGPLADADRYMPNFISMMSRGLSAGVPQMQQAAYLVAAPLARVNPASGQSGYGSIPYGRPPVSSSNAYNSSVGGTNYHYYGPVTVVAQGANAKEVAKEVMDLQNFQLRRSGALRVMTSGGKSH